MDLVETDIIDPSGHPTTSAEEAADHAPAMSELSTDDFMAVRNGTAKLGDMKAAPVTAGEESSVEKTTVETKDAKPAAVKAAAEKPAVEKPKGRAADRKESIQAEINALTRERGETQRERDAIRAEVETLRAEMASLRKPAAEKPAEKPAAAVESKEPVWADFEEAGRSWDEYLKAERAYTRAEAVREAKAEAKKAFDDLQTADRARIERDTADRTNATLAEHYSKSLEDARELYADFDAVLDQELPISAPMRAAIYNDCENPAAVLYHLGQNPEECKRIARLAPGSAMKAIGRLEGRLFASAEAAHSGPTPAAKPLTRPATPIQPVGASASTSTVPDSELSTDERNERRNAAERKAHGRA